MTIKSTGEDAYFCASNSAFGFYSYYPQCFDSPRIGRVFAIKGGPGTGKSRFLREVARYGEERGWKCEYIYCSSDADSLDGVILSREEECMALLDATAPHVYEPSQPGVREELVNLGAFWDRDALRRRAEEIKRLTTEKKDAYRMAYRYLAAYGEMSANRDELVLPYLRPDAMESYAERLLWNVAQGRAFVSEPALIRSVGMGGRIGFDTYFARAKRIYLVEDCRGCAQYFMRILYHMAERKRLRIRVSYDPVLPDRIDGIFLCESGIAIVVGKAEECAYPHKPVGTRRFVNISSMKKIKAPLVHAEQMCRAMLGGAVDALERVRAAHFRAEEIYGSAMDFEKKEAFTKKFCEELFDLQSDE